MGTGAGLIIAIGAQNAYVFTQGLRGGPRFTVATICSLCDILLIGLGIAGVGAAVASQPILAAAAAWAGSIFLLWYAVGSFRSMARPGTLEAGAEATAGIRSAVLTTLAITLLNPHVYLDTMVLLGSIGGQYPEDDRYIYGLGAMSASVLWFFTLCYGARLLEPVFRTPLAWKVLDGVIGLIMLILSFTLAKIGVEGMA